MNGGLWKSTSSVALFAAAGLFAFGMAMPSAKAADLGGDCCADLEERVAELEATTARKGNRRVSLTISGQVATGLMHWNDGGSVAKFGFNPPPAAPALQVIGSNSSDTYVVDNVMGGGTFFAFAGNAKINPDVTAGFQVVVALETGARSHQVSQNNDDATTSTDIQITMTLANWYLDHKALGRLTVGRINTATAGVTTVDLGGAGVIANASFGYTQRGMFLALNDTLLSTASTPSRTWSTVMGGGDVNGASLSRANAIMYSSPTFGGFSVGASFGEDNIWDVALRYAGEMGGFRIAGAVGYINNSNGLNEITKDHSPGSEPDIWKGSASVMHVQSGLYLTGAYLRKDWDDPARQDTTLWYVQAGIAKNWTGLGNTVVYGEYGRVNDGITGVNGAPFGGFGPCGPFGCSSVVVSSQATMWGVGIVQHVDAAAMELFLAYKRYSAEVTTSDSILFGLITFENERRFNDMDVIVGGARIRF